MFYVSGLDEKTRLWKITDSDDGVEESYSFKELKEFRSQGIEILGMSDNCCHSCIVIDNFIISPDVKDNAVVIRDLSNGKCTDKFFFHDVRNKRNIVWFAGNLGVKKVKNNICVSCAVCVKYDFEFNGTFVIKLNSKGMIVDKLDDVLFVCDDTREAHSMIASTGGDCPNLITSIKATKILKEKGLM